MDQPKVDDVIIVDVKLIYYSTAGIDYGRSSPLVHNVTITAGMASSSFDVDIIDNMIQDGDKMFTITIRLISTCLPVTINSDTTTVTIIDDEGCYWYSYILCTMWWCCFVLCSAQNTVCIKKF